MERRTFIKAVAATTLLGTIPLSVQAKPGIPNDLKSYRGFEIKRRQAINHNKNNSSSKRPISFFYAARVNGWYSVDAHLIPICDFKKPICIEDLSRLVDITLSETSSFGLNSEKQIWVISTDNPNIWGLGIPPVPKSERWILKNEIPNGIKVYKKNQDRIIFCPNKAGEWIGPVKVNGDQGHKLPGMKDQDLFIPLKENWLNINRANLLLVVENIGTVMKRKV